MFALKTYQNCHRADFFKRKALSGFTLLEVLASILIFSVMITGISMTLSESTKLTRKVKAREVAVMSAQIALDRLQRDLQMAFLEKQKGSAASAGTSSFFKSVDASDGPELTFSYLDTPLKVLVQNRTPGMMTARYHLEKADSGALTLYRSETPYYKLADDMLQTPSQILAEGVLSLKLEFYNFRTDQWLNKWDTSDPVTPGIFPRAVKIVLEVTDTQLPKEEWKNKSLKIETAFQVLNELDQK